MHRGSSSSSHSFKVVLLGEGCVGKTSCVLRFVEDTFSDKHVTTLQASFLTKKLNLGGRRCHLSIWDTAGQERFHALGPIYYRDADGALLVYDVTDADSFGKVRSWVKELRKMLGSDISLAIAGNKVDLEAQRRVDHNMAEEYAKSVGASHYLTSAKLNRGVEEAFLGLTQQMLSRKKTQHHSSSSGSENHHSSSRDTVTIVAAGGNSSSGGRSSKCCGGASDPVVEGIPVDESLVN